MGSFWLGLIFCLAGVYTGAAGFFNWDFFMRNRRVRFVISILGRMGARIFYMILGLLIFIGGLLSMFGVVNLYA